MKELVRQYLDQSHLPAHVHHRLTAAGFSEGRGEVDGAVTRTRRRHLPHR